MNTHKLNSRDAEVEPRTDEEVPMVMCGHCDKKITYNLIASFGADHHDPDEIHCEDCLGEAEARAESAWDAANGR